MSGALAQILSMDCPLPRTVCRSRTVRDVVAITMEPSQDVPNVMIVHKHFRSVGRTQKIPRQRSLFSQSQKLSLSCRRLSLQVTNRRIGSMIKMSRRKEYLNAESPPCQWRQGGESTRSTRQSESIHSELGANT